MSRKQRLMRVVRKYVKNMSKHAEEAFSLGFDDGTAGRAKALPDLPDPEDKRLYAALLFAQALYEDGYERGASVKNEPF